MRMKAEKMNRLTTLKDFIIMDKQWKRKDYF